MKTTYTKIASRIGKILFLLGFFITNVSCSSDNNDSATIPETVYPPATNKVLLLKVDFETSVFEGGKELAFDNTNTFTIGYEYQSPGDFGGIKLKYAELDQNIFQGTIHWMGEGQIQYPADIAGAGTFLTISEPVQMPNTSLFETVEYYENAFYPDIINYSGIWNSIRNLEVVSQYRTSNPNSKIHLFLYTPCVGTGNSAHWDWFIILKN